MHLVGQAQVNSFASQSYGQGMFQMSAYLLQTLAREFGSQLRAMPQAAITAPQPAGPLAEPPGPPPAAVNTAAPATPANTAGTAAGIAETESFSYEDEESSSSDSHEDGEEEDEEEAQKGKGRGKGEGKQQARLCACYVLACMHARTCMHAT